MGRSIIHISIFFCISPSFSAPIFLKIYKLILWKGEVFVCYVCRPEGINFQFRRTDEWIHVPWVGVGGQICDSWRWLTAKGSRYVQVPTCVKLLSVLLVQSIAMFVLEIIIIIMMIITIIISVAEHPKRNPGHRILQVSRSHTIRHTRPVGLL